jgi:hypothetical protein
MKKPQGLRTGEHTGKIPLLIILFRKTLDKSYRDIHAVGDLVFFRQCHLTEWFIEDFLVTTLELNKCRKF